MLKLVRRAAVLLVLPVVATGAALTVSAAPSAAATPATLASQVASLTNQQRAKAGCAGLRWDSRLATAARAQSGYMSRHSVMTHTGSGGSTFVTRARAAGYNYAIGENVAYGYYTASGVVSSWMKSAPHRKNILNCKAKKIGVGVAYNTKGVPYWTQVFGSV